MSLGTSYNILFVATQGVNQEPNMYFPVKYLVKYQADGTTNESWVTYKEKGIEKVNKYLTLSEMLPKYVHTNLRLI